MLKSEERVRVSRGERIELGKKFIDVLKGFLSVSAKTTPEDIDDLVSKVPFGKIISFVYGLGRIYERIETPEEALHIAIVLGVLRSLEETLVEFAFSKEQIEKILEELKVDSEKERRIQELAIPEKFSPDDLLNPDSEIYKSIKEIFLKPVKSYLLINNEVFAKRFGRKLKLNFWRIIEENENKFRFLLDKFKSEEYKEAVRKYRIEKYRREILKRFDTKIKDPRTASKGKKVSKIIRSFLKIRFLNKPDRFRPLLLKYDLQHRTFLYFLQLFLFLWFFRHLLRPDL